MAAGPPCVAARCSRSADRHKVDELSERLQEKRAAGLPLKGKQADCVAKVYLESDLSRQALASVKKGQPLTPKTKGDREAIQEITNAISDDCLTSG